MQKEQAEFSEKIDSSWIARFPKGFFQKGVEHMREHPDEEFTMQVTETRVFLRRMKRRVNGIRLKNKINGQIITRARIMIESHYEE